MWFGESEANVRDVFDKVPHDLCFVSDLCDPKRSNLFVLGSSSCSLCAVL